MITRPYDGWKFGLSIINLFGTIQWAQGGSESSASINPLSSSFYPFTWGDSTLNANESILYTFNIDTIRADKLGGDSLFTNETIFFVPDEKTDFKIRVPSTFRFGISKKFKDYLIGSDLIAGFEDRFYSRKQWKWSIGAEWNRIKTMPMRIGYGFGGGDFQELGLGFGIKRSRFMFDFGFAFRNGLWLHTMKGFNLSFGLTILGKKKERQASSQPMPVP